MREEEINNEKRKKKENYFTKENYKREKISFRVGDSHTSF
jgi:hypothetical protein